jgi:hypothetical protein
MDQPPPSDSLPDDFGQRLLDQLLSIWVIPEVERRHEEGLIEKPFQLVFAQVVFRVGEAPEVRLNGEVRGSALARHSDPEKALKVGEELYVSDIAGIEHFELPEEDVDAGHITLVSLAEGMAVSFDATYNRSRVAEHLALADDFFSAAELALASGHLAPFAENAFATAELLAKAELLPLPDKAVLDGKTHKTVLTRLHWWARMGNIDPQFPRLLQRLAGLRAGSRYLRGAERLTEAEAGTLLEELAAMREHVRARAPQRGPDRPRRRIAMIAGKPLRQGDVVTHL